MFEIEPFKRKLGVARASGIVLCLFALGAANLTGAAQAKSDKEESRKARRRSRFLRQRPKSSRAPVCGGELLEQRRGSRLPRHPIDLPREEDASGLAFLHRPGSTGHQEARDADSGPAWRLRPGGRLDRSFGKSLRAVRSASKLQPSRLLCRVRRRRSGDRIHGEG